MKLFPVVFLMCIPAFTNAQLNIVPAPSEIEIKKGYLILKQPIGFIYNNPVETGDGGVHAFQNYCVKSTALQSSLQEIHIVMDCRQRSLLILEIIIKTKNIRSRSGQKK